MPQERVLTELAGLADRNELRAALALLNATAHSRARFTGMYRIENDWIFGIETFDRQNPDASMPVSAPAMTSYCLGVYESDAPLAVTDSLEDERLASHPARKTWQSYAGVPLHDPDGRLVGTICHYDYTPSHMTPNDISPLRDAAPILARFAYVDRYR